MAGLNKNLKIKSPNNDFFHILVQFFPIFRHFKMIFDHFFSFLTNFSQISMIFNDLSQSLGQVFIVFIILFSQCPIEHEMSYTI